MFILSSVILFFVTILLCLKYVYSHWERHSFPYIRPTIPAGNLGPVARQKLSFGLTIYELYKQSTEPFIGIYLLFRPAILIRDASLMKRILTTDFNHFHDRGIYCNPENDPFSENLFAMTGSRWRNLRMNLTPSFTSGRLKGMMSTITDEADILQTHLKPFAADGKIMEMKEIVSRYTLNVIASVIFGVKADCIRNPDDKFRTIEKELRQQGLINGLKAVAVFLCPKVLEFFKMASFPPTLHKFMIDIVTQQIHNRESHEITRKDFIQFLIEMRSDSDKQNNHGNKMGKGTMEISIEQCAAQIFIFYVAGFESSASTIAFTLAEISANPDIHKRLQNEIHEKLRKYDGTLTYECLKEMDYLESCVLETIRKYPGLPILNRECTKDYQIPDSKLTIKKGTAIVISLLGLFRDPQYFPDPETYRPERFIGTPTHNPDAFIPFGDGPRACIALRLGKLIAKIGLVKLMQNFSFARADNKEMEFDNFGVGLTIKGGINLKVTNYINDSM